MRASLSRCAVAAAAASALCLSGVAAQAGSKAGGGYMEPIVTPLVVFQETVQEVLAAPTVGYFGIMGHGTATRADGRLTSDTPRKPCSCSRFSLNLPSHESKPGLGFVLGARKVAEGGFLMGGELFFNPAYGSQTANRTRDFGGGPGIGDPFTVRYTQTARLGNELGARFLVGYEFDRLRWYGAVGAAGAKASVTLDSDRVGRFASASRTMMGSTLAAGMEVDATSNGTLRLEMSRTGYGRMNFGTDNDGRHSVDFTNSRISVGFFLRN